MSPVILSEHRTGSEGKGEGHASLAIIGTGTSVPQGLEAILEYSGIFLGDTSTIDCYFVTSIDGLGDADVRDSRENLPSDHGERAFDAFYGGRTIVISGFIRAHNVKKLRDMQEALRTAFIELEEKPLYFRTADSTYDHYINCRKLQSIQMTEVQNNAYNLFRDFQITLRASDPRFLSVTEKTITISHNLIDNPGFEFDTLSAAPANWKLNNPNAFTSTIFQVVAYSDEHGEQGLRFGGTKPNNSTQHFISVSSQIGNTTSGVTAGEVYKFMSRVKVEEADAGSFGVKAKIDYYSSGSANLGSFESEYFTSGVDQDISISAPAPDNSVYASAIVQVDTTTPLDQVRTILGDGRFFRVLDSENEDQVSNYITKCGDTEADLLALYILNSQYGATDLTGNENDGTGSGGVELGSATDSPVGFDSSTAFDGVNDYISTPLASAFQNGTKMTFTGWAFRDSSTSEDHIIGGDNMALFTLVSGASNNIQFDPNTSTGPPITWGGAWPGNNRWVHWVLTFDEIGNTVEIWINGKSKGSQNMVEGWTLSPGQFHIGSSQNGFQPFHGKIVGVAIFEGGLTQNEISDLYILGLNKIIHNDVGTGTIVNSGNFPSKPRVRVGGEMHMTHIYNDTNDEEFLLASSVVVPNGDFYELNSSERTLKDASGDNVFGDLDFTSDIPQLESGDNSIRLDRNMHGKDIGSVTYFFSDTWL